MRSAREMLEEHVEPLNREGDPARAGLRRVRLDEERGVLVNVPQHLIPDAHVRGSAEEPRVPVNADLKIGDRDTGDKLGDRAHLGRWIAPLRGLGRAAKAPRISCSNDG